jgi:hypothetical protein
VLCCAMPARLISSACCLAVGCCSGMRCRRWSASSRSSSGPAGLISSGSGASTGNDTESFIFA